MSNEMSRRSSLMAAGVAFVKSNGPLMACILIVAPLLATGWVALFYCFCFRIWWIIGRSPVAKGDRFIAHLSNGMHDHILAIGLIFIIPLAFLIWSIACAIALAAKTISFRQAGLISLGWLPILFVVFIDPNGWFWNVFFD
ncbi:hypothetical protein KIH39_22980 [Telmatocola sphagniphila]|uniref:Uncharacterized protein n=1 Tax=Telmatocola sphagniphila TaxID=1123043 RepID=A0A8E6B498_9BACT|nr:hypothetical protein [Telmatocola sphagniphila]QVL31678.1 hypothetical protein KIH39_22980 [Telmatocola sphagniphila]